MGQVLLGGDLKALKDRGFNNGYVWEAWLEFCWVSTQWDTGEQEVRSVRNHTKSLTTKVKANGFLGLSKQ